MERSVYARGCQYENIESLHDAIEKARDQIELRYLKTLYHSMTRRMKLLRKKAALSIIDSIPVNFAF